MTRTASDERERARALLVDYLVVETRGAGSAPARAARTAFDGDVIEDIALVNGVAAHSIELDDTYEPGSIHPGVCVWPAALALGEITGATLGELLDAGIAGYDAACSAADLLDPGEVYSRGFHPTGVCGPLGAAAAAATLLDLAPAEVENAIAIATSSAGGLLAFLANGAWTKPLHAGQAAAAGLRAARLAQAGFTGPRDALHGRNGLLHAFGAREAPAAAPESGYVLATATKPYPCCRYAHAAIDVVLDLRAKHGLTQHGVRQIQCAVLDAGARLVAEPPALKLRIDGPVDAQFSLPFLLALALTDGAVELDTLEQAPRHAPRLAETMASVTCVRSERLETAFPQRWGAEVALELTDGSFVRGAVESAPGSPDRPANRAGLQAKATSLLGFEPAAALLETWLDGPLDAQVARLRAVPSPAS